MNWTTAAAKDSHITAAPFLYTTFSSVYTQCCVARQYSGCTHLSEHHPESLLHHKVLDIHCFTHFQFML